MARRTKAIKNNFDAKEAWDEYCKGAGGVNYLGKPLPTWDELGEATQAAHIQIEQDYINNKLPHPMTPEQLFEKYRELRGGKTYDGKETPHWDGLSESPQNGWKAVGLYYFGTQSIADPHERALSNLEHSLEYYKDQFEPKGNVDMEYALQEMEKCLKTLREIHTELEAKEQ